MNILITGGTGLIGRKLCTKLLKEGHSLTVLSRAPASVESKCGAGVHAIASLGEWQSDQFFDAVINLAGESIVDARWTTKRKQALWDSRVGLTEQLVTHINVVEHKPTVLLSGSAIGYYGNRDDVELDEAAVPGHDFAAQLCMAWEDSARAAEHAGLRVCLLRTGLVLSQDGGLLGRLQPLFKFWLGARLGNGRQWMSWVHIDDYVEGLISLLYNVQCHGVFNMTAPLPVTNAEFTATLAKVLRRVAFFTAPTMLVKMIMGERSCLLLEGQRVLPGRLSAAGYLFRFSNLSDALSNLIRK